jgi:hypothetical protein
MGGRGDQPHKSQGRPGGGPAEALEATGRKMKSAHVVQEIGVDELAAARGLVGLASFIQEDYGGPEHVRHTVDQEVLRVTEGTVAEGAHSKMVHFLAKGGPHQVADQGNTLLPDGVMSRLVMLPRHQGDPRGRAGGEGSPAVASVTAGCDSLEKGGHSTFPRAPAYLAGVGRVDSLAVAAAGRTGKDGP